MDISYNSLPITIKLDIGYYEDDHEMILFVKSNGKLFGVTDPGWHFIQQWPNKDITYLDDTIKINSLGNIDEAYIVLFDYPAYMNKSLPKFRDEETCISLYAGNEILYQVKPSVGDMEDYCWIACSLRIAKDGSVQLSTENTYVDIFSFLTDNNAQLL